jgi:hypothetical protein
VAFFVLTYALTWWAVPFGSFIASGPLIAALIVLPITQGWAGLRELGRQGRTPTHDQGISAHRSSRIGSAAPCAYLQLGL